MSKRLLITLLLPLSLCACQRPAQPVAATPAPAQEDVRAEVDGIVVEARGMPAIHLNADIARRHAIERADDVQLLLVTLRDRAGDAVATDGLVVTATASVLPDAPAPVALKRVETDGMADLIATYRAPPPGLVLWKIDARRGHARAQFGLTYALSN